MTPNLTPREAETRKWRTIVVDPPWAYSQKWSGGRELSSRFFKGGTDRGAACIYDVMDQAALMALPLGAWADEAECSLGVAEIAAIRNVAIVARAINELCNCRGTGVGMTHLRGVYALCDHTRPAAPVAPAVSEAREGVWKSIVIEHDGLTSVARVHGYEWRGKRSADGRSFLINTALDSLIAAVRAEALGGTK